MDPTTIIVESHKPKPRTNRSSVETGLALLVGIVLALRVVLLVLSAAV
jgi:hypothetical protein